MIAFLISMAPFLPVVLDIVGMFFSAFGASAENLKLYQDMITKQNQSGLLSLQSHDRLLAHQAAIEARMKSKNKE